MIFCLFIITFSTPFYSKLCNWVGDALTTREINLIRYGKWWLRCGHESIQVTIYASRT